jgi:hypothetical protein
VFPQDFKVEIGIVGMGSGSTETGMLKWRHLGLSGSAGLVNFRESTKPRNAESK